MDSRIDRGMKRQARILAHLACIACAVPLMMSTSLAQSLSNEQSVPSTVTLLSQSEKLMANQSRGNLEDTSPIRVEMILPKKEWVRPSSSEKIQIIPLKVRITNMSDSPITFVNVLPRAYFNFSVVDDKERSIDYPSVSLGGRNAFAYIGEAFPTEEYGECPIVGPGSSIEADWNVKLDWRDEEVLIELRLNKLLPNPWESFKASHSGTYRLKLNYNVPIERKNLCQRRAEKSLSNATFLEAGKSSYAASEVDIVLDR
jgi:hypothetical protein